MKTAAVDTPVGAGRKEWYSTRQKVAGNCPAFSQRGDGVAVPHDDGVYDFRVHGERRKAERRRDRDRRGVLRWDPLRRERRSGRDRRQATTSSPPPPGFSSL
jgi:hypothetical protein